MPQGSPLSLGLFVVAFNQLSIIISTHKYIEHSVYADDAITFTERSDHNKVKELSLNILKDMISVCHLELNLLLISVVYSIFLTNSIAILSTSNTIIKETGLCILRELLDKIFTFKQHCIYLRKIYFQD